MDEKIELISYLFKGLEIRCIRSTASMVMT
jgi:hypothetical protein